MWYGGWKESCTTRSPGCEQPSRPPFNIEGLQRCWRKRSWMDIILHHLKAPRKQHWLGGRGGDSVSLLQLCAVTGAGFHPSTVLWTVCCIMLLPNVCWHPPNCYPPNKDATDLCYLLYGCANASLNKFPFEHAKSPTKFHRQSCYPPNQDATDLFYLLYGCANACLNKFPFAHTKTLSSSQLLPTNKDCACTPPEAELHKLRVLQCTYSARTVHATVHATVHGHNTL